MAFSRLAAGVRMADSPRVLLALRQLVRRVTNEAPSRTVEAAPPSKIMVREWHDHQWYSVRWSVDTEAELKANIGRGRLLEVDERGAPSCAVVSRTQLRPGAIYVFKDAATTDFAGAVRDLAAGHERESTEALAADARLRDAFGALRLFNDGEPYTFRGADSPVLHADGIVLPDPQRRVVLLNEAKLAPAAADVIDVVTSALMLQLVLRGKLSVTNFPPELQAHRKAHVVPCLSGANFDPHVLALAVAQGVVPVVCSGARFHVAPQAPDPLSVLRRTRTTSEAVA